MEIAGEYRGIHLPLVSEAIRRPGRSSLYRKNRKRDIRSLFDRLALWLRDDDNLVFAKLKAATSAEANDDACQGGEHDDP